ncbi:hypothetical protein I79_020436 [Cricetulus griseus]|uniref:Secreted protein n=1 Tax=Cricetulus griseus TaxID=10029 RepID=G3IA20_CRIGR|nr:hypothetical protein I79_020436 [Cricetulus griseus]
MPACHILCLAVLRAALGVESQRLLPVTEAPAFPTRTAWPFLQLYKSNARAVVRNRCSQLSTGPQMSPLPLKNPDLNNIQDRNYPGFLLL